MSFMKLYYFLFGAIALLKLAPNTAFTTSRQILHHRTSPSQQQQQQTSSLFALYSPGRSSSRSGKERSKRQYRVSQLVQTELGKILHSGLIKGDVDYLEDELRQRISIVSVDVSPDLRQARVSTSVRATTGTTSTTSDDGSSGSTSSVAVDRRRAYSWLVSNAGPLRHTLAQKMSHMKTSPSLSFVQVDVAAAVGKFF